MERLPEPELMNGYEQARAYACADFNGPNSLFIKLFTDTFPETALGNVLDLGCGPADICIRFAMDHPQSKIYGVDGSPAMLDFARQEIASRNLINRIFLIKGMLPHIKLPEKQYSAIISNSLLHHLPDPMTLWNLIKSYALKGTAVLIMDLMRPKNRKQAKSIVKKYSAKESEILKKDFFNSLLAAYRIEEVKNQLKQARIDSLKVEAVSDRHLVIKGFLL